MSQLARGQWGGQWAFVLASAGAAIGLGNIWKFPYMAGDNGGGAFVVVYLVCVIIIGLPVMAAEIFIGRRAQQNPIDAIKTVAKESAGSQRWSGLGWWGLLGLLLVLSFYSVVGGWTAFYLIKTLTGGLNHLNAHQINAVWGHFMASPGKMLAYHLVFMMLTMVVVAMGVEKGLERASLIMMPLLFVVLIALVIYASVSTGPYFHQAVTYLSHPDWHKMTAQVFINATGHAFFTLAVGVGAMSIYGSYLPKHISIGQSIAVTALLDVMVALLAGLAIFPLIFAHHLSPQAGPGLMFMSLPIAFSHLSGGLVLGSLFFILLLFAAWTSSINIAEPLVASLFERTRCSRKMAALIIGLVAWVLGIVSVLSFNLWSHVQLFGHFTPFDAITDVVTNIIQPLGGLGYALFAGWVILKPHSREELDFTPRWFGAWRFAARYVVPIGILSIFIKALV